MKDSIISIVKTVEDCYKQGYGRSLMIDKSTVDNLLKTYSLEELKQEFKNYNLEFSHIKDAQSPLNLMYRASTQNKYIVYDPTKLLTNLE